MNLDKLATRVQDLPERAAMTQINAAFRRTDESHLWPISGQYNVTDRAIRQLAAIRRDGCGPHVGLEYILALDSLISQLVNQEQ